MSGLQTVALNRVSTAVSPTVLFLPGAMCPPAVFAPAARLLGVPTLGVRHLEGAGPHTLEEVSVRVLGLTHDVGPVVLVGHSVGSAVATLVAHLDALSDEPVVTGLVLSNSGASTRGLADLGAILAQIDRDWGPAFWQNFAHRCVSVDIDAEQLADLAAYSSRLDPMAIIDVLRSQERTDLLPALRTLDVPTVVVHGLHDRARTLAHATEMAGAVAGSELVVLETGHTSCLEAPEAFAATVTRVLDRSVAASNAQPDTDIVGTHGGPDVRDRPG